MTTQRLSRKITWLFPIAALALVIALALMSGGRAQADGVGFGQDPDGCLTNGAALSMAAFVDGNPTTGPVLHGADVDYRMTVSLADGGGILECNVIGGQLSVTYPDGTLVELAGFGAPTPNIGLIDLANPFIIKVSDVTGTTPYTAVHAFEPLFATGDYGSTADQPGQDFGESQSLVHNLDASATASNTLPVIHPSTDLSIDANPPGPVLPGDTVDLLIIEENNGDTPIFNVSVVLNFPGGPLVAPPDNAAAEDTTNPGVLDPGEKWEWTVTSGVINADTTFTATATGTDILGTVINSNYCATADLEPGVLCKEDDSVDVLVEDPSTSLNVSVPNTIVEANTVVPVTISDTNDGTEDITTPTIEVLLNGVPIAGSPFGVGTLTSGDVANFGVMDAGSPGETWVWVINITVSPGDTVSAIGHGFALGFDITACDDPDNPPTSPPTICDQDEEDSVTFRTTAVGGVTEFFGSGSGSSSGSIALLVGGIAAIVAVATAGGWYTRRRWMGNNS